MWKNICPENTFEDAHETNTRRPETEVQQRLEGSQGYVWNLRQKFRNNFKSKSKFILFYGINDNVTKRRFENVTFECNPTSGTLSSFIPIPPECLVK